MVNKDVTHPKMRRRIENPRVVLLDCNLEYKKGESQTNVEVTDESHWARLLEIEEQQVKEMCDHIIKVQPDLVFTEKGVSGGLVICKVDFLSKLEWLICDSLPRLGSALSHESQHYRHPSCT